MFMATVFTTYYNFGCGQHKTKHTKKAFRNTTLNVSEKRLKVSTQN